MARHVKYQRAKENPMTPLTKTFIAFLAVAALVTGTVALRGRHAAQPETAMADAGLTPAQLAEINPPQQPKPVAAVQPQQQQVEIPPPPSDDEPDLEDGNGS